MYMYVLTEISTITGHLKVIGATRDREKAYKIAKELVERDDRYPVMVDEVLEFD